MYYHWKCIIIQNTEVAQNLNLVSGLTTSLLMRLIPDKANKQN